MANRVNELNNKHDNQTQMANRDVGGASGTAAEPGSAARDSAPAGQNLAANSPQRNPNSRSKISAIQQCIDVVGYMEKRGDFEQEYDMDAELLLTDMEFFEDDTAEQIKLKNSVIELYNARLDERIRRKKFVIERGLLDIKRTQKFERKRTKEERDIINSMKIFARFSTEDEHQKIVANLIKERMLREVIE